MPAVHVQLGANGECRVVVASAGDRPCAVRNGPVRGATPETRAKTANLCESVQNMGSEAAWAVKQRTNADNGQNVATADVRRTNRLYRQRMPTHTGDKQVEQ